MGEATHGCWMEPQGSASPAKRASRRSFLDKSLITEFVLPCRLTVPYLDWYARSWLASRCAVNGPEPFHLMLAGTASPDKRLWAVPRFDEKPTMHGLIGRIPSGRVLAR
jgi:hypothetical protein